MKVMPIMPLVVGIAPPIDPNTPVIMAPVDEPPATGAKNGNPGIVPPWLQGR